MNQRVRDIYQVKNAKISNYTNEVWDLIEHYFSSFNLSHIFREVNELVDSFVIAASNFKVLHYVKASYDIEGKHRPSIPKNIKH